MDIGIDIVKNDRFTKYLKNLKFLSRILSVNEINKFNNMESDIAKINFLAGRFSAKEAIIKATNKKLLFSKISIENLENGKPIVFYDNKIMNNILISISHENDYSVSFSMFI